MRTYILLGCIITFLPKCATIVSKSSWPFSIQTEPRGAKVTITNKRGIVVLNSRTPTALRLKSGSGFFSKEKYTITLSLKGYETKTVIVDCKLNGWYFGNILFGGVIGLLIVDPASGAMYKLESEGVYESLEISKSTSSTGPGLDIIDISQVPAKFHNQLVKLPD